MTRNGDAPQRAPADEPPAAAADRVREELVAFARGLRRAGANVPVNASLTGAETLGEIGLEDRERARHALRAALLTRHEDKELFDRLFEQFWSALRDAVEAPTDDESPEGGLEPTTLEAPNGDATGSAGEEADVTDIGARRGVTERSTAGDADDEETRATYSPVGRPEAVERVATGSDEDRTVSATGRITRALAQLPGRRDERSGVGRRIDARAALRESLSTGGTVTSLPRRQRSAATVRGVVFADVSRSVLDVIDREFLVAFLRVLRSEWRSARVFLFDTDVREVTSALDAPSTAAAYEELERAETKWGGGTRIGHALTTVRDRHPDAVDRRTIVVVISDGLEMGDISDLEEGITWVARRAPHVLWLNPLATSPEFEPTASGMETAAPHVDGIFPFNSPADLEEMARQLERYDGTESLGYQHDSRRVA